MDEIARLRQQLIDAEARHKDAEANLIKLCTQLEDLLAERTRELAEAREAVDAAAASKGAFLANMSHEIRTPLNSVVGLSHLIGGEGLSAEQAERIAQLSNAAEQLLDIVNAILDLAKIDAGKLTLEPSPLEVESIVAATITKLEERARLKGLQLVTDLGSTPPNLIGDAARLEQALANFATNAVKFTDRGSVTIRSRLIDQDAASALIRFEVEDTGIGIDPESVPKLFSAFGQADSATTLKWGGTGLGLAITQALAELMGGEAGAWSTPGKGSTFWFTARLQRAIAATSGRAAPDEKNAADALKREFAGTPVLLVEDNEINREVGHAVLGAVGLAVDTAEDGVEALAKVAANDYALIVMDLQMPRMDGLEATREIRKSRPAGTLPIVALTANAFSEDRARCLEAGMDDFISKPVMPDVLYASLLEQLRKRSQPAGAGPG